MIAFCTNCLALKVASGIISFALHIALPDMFIGTKEMSYSELYLRMFHEFSHASHFRQIGEWKWGDVIWYEMLHKGYGKTRDNSRGEDYVELTESYSYAMENYVENELFYPVSPDDYFRGNDKFFKISTWHLLNLLIEGVIAPSAMSRALNGASHINDLHKNLYMYNGGKTPKLNEEFRKKWEDRGK